MFNPLFYTTTEFLALSMICVFKNFKSMQPFKIFAFCSSFNYMYLFSLPYLVTPISDGLGNLILVLIVSADSLTKQYSFLIIV